MRALSLPSWPQLGANITAELPRELGSPSGKEGQPEGESNDSAEKNVLGVKPDVPLRGALLGHQGHSRAQLLAGCLHYCRNQIRKHFNKGQDRDQTPLFGRFFYFWPRD